MRHSSSTGPARNASSSGESFAGGAASNFFQSGLPVKSSASHQTSPASSASRSVSEIEGSTPLAQRKMGLVIVSRRKLMVAPIRSTAMSRQSYSNMGCGNGNGMGVTAASSFEKPAFAALQRAPQDEADFIPFTLMVRSAQRARLEP